jgi:hypothetical protein
MTWGYSSEHVRTSCFTRLKLNPHTYLSKARSPNLRYFLRPDRQSHFSHDLTTQILSRVRTSQVLDSAPLTFSSSESVKWTALMTSLTMRPFQNGRPDDVDNGQSTIMNDPFRSSRFTKPHGLPFDPFKL